MLLSAIFAATGAVVSGHRQRVSAPLGSQICVPLVVPSSQKQACDPAGEQRCDPDVPEGAVALPEPRDAVVGASLEQAAVHRSTQQLKRIHFT